MYIEKEILELIESSTKDRVQANVKTLLYKTLHIIEYLYKTEQDIRIAIQSHKNILQNIDKYNEISPQDFTIIRLQALDVTDASKLIENTALKNDDRTFFTKEFTELMISKYIKTKNFENEHNIVLCNCVSYIAAKSYCINTQTLKTELLTEFLTSLFCLIKIIDEIKK